MDYIALILIAVSLAMDAFAVAITSGITIKNVRPRHAAEFGLMFGGLQFAMPIAGFFLGSLFSVYIESIDHWVAFALLVFIGSKMLIDTFRGGKTANPTAAGQAISLGRLFLLGIATSIDALAVGVSIALTGWDIWVSALVIGAVAFAFSYAGVMAGKRLGPHLQKYAGMLGGLVLIAIGVKILLEHLLI